MDTTQVARTGQIAARKASGRGVQPDRGWLLASTAAFGQADWFTYVMIPGALIPVLMIFAWGD